MLKKFFRSIRFRIWIAFVAFTLVMTASLFCSQTMLTPAFYHYMKTQESVEALNLIRASLSGQIGDSVDINGLVNRLATERQLDILISFQKERFVYSKNASGSTESINTRVNESMVSQFFKDGSDTFMVQKTENGVDALFLGGYITNGFDDDPEIYYFVYCYLEPMGTTMRILNTLFFMSSIIMLFIAFVVALLLSSHISNPLIRISRSASSLITGNFNMPVRPHEYEEIATLTENLNEASKEIAKTENLRKDLIANVSHDLRTPLTMIKAYAEMIRDLSGNNPEKREKHLEVIIDETDRLTLLVADMLNLSKLQSGVVELNTSVFDFSEHLRGLINRFNLLDDTQDYHVELEAEGDIFICCDIKRIEQVVYNLTNNAINYIGEDKLVNVKLFRKNAKTGRFEVSDRGVGIPQEQIPYIWERYYKVERSENHKRAVKGTGLGLSIVKGILEGHRYTYGVDSVVGKGSTFWFEFPLEMPVIEAEAVTQ